MYLWLLFFKPMEMLERLFCMYYLTFHWRLCICYVGIFRTSVKYTIQLGQTNNHIYIRYNKKPTCLKELKSWLLECKYPISTIDKAFHNAKLQGPTNDPKKNRKRSAKLCHSFLLIVIIIRIRHCYESKQFTCKL